MRRAAKLAAAALVAGMVAIAGADDDDDRPAAPSAAASPAAPHRPTVSLTVEAASRLKLRVVPVERTGLAEVLSLTGTVAVNEDRTARIVPRLEGIVRQVHHTLGDRVAKDAVLAVLDSVALGTAKVEFLRAKQELELAGTELARKALLRDNARTLLRLVGEDLAPLALDARTRELAIGEHRSRVISAYANVRLARTNHEREKRLFQQRVNSAKTYQETTRDLETAEATFRTALDEARYTSELELQTAEKTFKTKETAFRSARLQLDVLGASDEDVRELERGRDRELTITTVRAPFGGTLIERRATVGERVTADSALFTLSDLSAAWVLADVYEADWARLRAGLTASVRVAAHPDRVFSGSVRVVSPVVDPTTRSARIRVGVDNGAGLLAVGMFATVDVAVAHSDALVVPREALQTLDGKSAVFVSSGERTYRAVTVSTGRQDERRGLVEIRAGLGEGDLVVTDGSFLLKSELSKDALQDDD